MANMTIGEKLAFIVTGKRPEQKEEEEVVIETNDNSSLPENSENIFEEHTNIPEKTPQKQFEEKTGMTLQKAEELIAKWEISEDTEKCAKGASLIAEFFPEHHTKKFLKDTPKNTETLHATSLPNKKITGSDFAKKVAQNPLAAVGISYAHGEENLPDENENDDTERLWSAISYIPFASIFVIMTQHQSRFTMYHAYQALALLFLSILVGTFGYVLGFIGMGFVAGLIHFFIFFMSIFAGFTALNGRYITIPFISGIAKTLSGRK